MSGTVQEAVEQQRKEITFQQTKLSQFLYGKEQYWSLMKKFQKLPQIPYDFNMYNESRVQWMKQAYKMLPLLANQFDFSDYDDILYLILACTQQMPGSVHLGMFLKCIEFMGTPFQQKQYLDKCWNFQIIGCYAQTEMGHGSDVQSLETTATYVQGSDQFIINTPSISAAKYWPGDLGISANYALVFAQLIVKGKNYGVQSFLVPIRDANHDPYPGIQIGDIGPKIGFHAKDNGYLIMNNIRIPKRNMLRKFISVSKKGQIKRKGDPKVSYATMMTIRQHISCLFPKVYGQAITIATRYSIFRKQFKNSSKEEIKTIDYQLQQQKIITRVAEYYAIIIGGNKLRKLCQRNFALVTQKEDFTLMAQAHACLCMCKSFFSETAYTGMEICRRACGGHGYSHYSGFPSIIFQYTAHLTHEGENTILYLQTARYLLKSYKYFLTKKKQLGQSVKYIQSFDFLLSKKCQIDPNDPYKWTLEDIRVLLAQSVCYSLSRVTQKLMNKQQGVSDVDVWNQNAGLRLQQLGHAHACYYVYTNFRQSVGKQANQKIRQLLIWLVQLYGVHLLVTFSGPIIEGGFVQNQHITSLKNLKQILLKKLRPHLIGLVDGFGIPEKLLRSGLVRGNPYQNYLQLARKNPLNSKVQQSAIIIKNGIQEVLKPKL